MASDETATTDEAEPNEEFYVPATFQFSKAPGRIERIIVGLFDEGGDMEVRRASQDSIPEYYVPAMFQFSKKPGRIERFLKELFEGREDDGPLEIPEEFRDDFYLPGSNPDGYKRPWEQKPGRLKPANEVSSAKEESDGSEG